MQTRVRIKNLGLGHGRQAKLLKGALSLLLVLFSQRAWSTDSDFNTSSIYGTDSRVNIADSLNPKVKVWSKSVVSLVKMTNLSMAPDFSGKISGVQTYGESQQLCPGTPFFKEPAGAFCTGALVGPDLVLTAKHCVPADNTCDTTAFVFDFAIDEAGRDPLELPKNSIYSCLEVVKRFVAPAPADGSRDFTEYALVRLSRKVTDRAPLPIRRIGTPALGTPLVSIGSTMGLPLKAATGSVLSLDSNGTTLRAVIDTFTGNSGGPIINADTGVIEGVLVRGMADLEFDGALQCNHELKYAEQGVPGEVATLSSKFAADVPELTPTPVTTCQLKTVQYRIEGVRPDSLIGTELPTSLAKLNPAVRARLGEVVRKFESKIEFESASLKEISAVTYSVPGDDPVCQHRELQVRTGTSVKALGGRNRSGHPIPGTSQAKPDEFYLFDTVEVL